MDQFIVKIRVSKSGKPDTLMTAMRTVPALSIKAVEALARINRHEAEASGMVEISLEDMARRVISRPRYGALIWVLLFVTGKGIGEQPPPLENTPRLKEIAPIIAEQWPEIWAELRAGALCDCYQPHDDLAAFLDSVAAPPMQANGAAHSG